jgi:hypothetical protein
LKGFNSGVKGLIAHAQVARMFPLFTSERNNRHGNLRCFIHLGEKNKCFGNLVKQP